MMRSKMYCLVKFIYREVTNRQLDCNKCPCYCEYSGVHNKCFKGLLPTKRPETKGAEKK